MNNRDWLIKEMLGEKDAFSLSGRFVLYQAAKVVIEGKEISRCIIGGVGLHSPVIHKYTELIIGELIVIPQVKLISGLHGYRLDQMVCSNEFAHPEQNLGKGKFWEKQVFGKPLKSGK